MTFSYKTLRQITFDLQLVSFTFRFVGCTVYLLMALFLSQALAQPKAVLFSHLQFILYTKRCSNYEEENSSIFLMIL